MAKKPVFVEQDNMLNPLKGINVGYDPKLAVADLDGDGDQDVLVGDNYEKIQYFRNEGDSFTELKGNDNPFKGVKLGWNPDPAVGDLDGDGDEDVLVGNDYEEIQYFRNEGDSFTELKGSDNPFKGVKLGGNPDPAVGDLDGDGDEDVLVGNDYGEIQYFQNKGDSFTELKGSDNPFDGVKLGWYPDPAVGDLDGDGDEDILVVDGYGEIKYFRNEGDSFTELKGSDNPFKGVKLEWDATTAIGDLDGDGDEDVLIGNDEGKIKYLENLTTDVNDAPIAKNDSVGIVDNNPLTINVLKNDFEPEAEPISLVEFEGDTEAGGTVERDDNETPENLTDDKLIYTPPADFSLNETDSFTYTITDPNNQTATATVNIFAIPLFVKQDNILNPFFRVYVGGYANPTVGDLDGDGDEDLLVGVGNLEDDSSSDGDYYKYGKIKYFRNDGDSFTEQKGSENPFDGVKLDSFIFPAVFDEDEDGDGDVLVGNGYGKIQYFRNDGDSFTEQKGNDNPFNEVDVDWHASPAVGDLDGDGDEDVLVGDNDGKILYFRNDGDSFTEQKGSENPFNGVDVGEQAAAILLDGDSDGDKDLLVGNGEKLKYFRNDGDGFSEQKLGQNPFLKMNLGYAATPTVIDLNGDGDEDVLVSRKVEISYIENLTTDVNEAPITKNDSVGIADDTPISINVLKNDFEPEAEPFSLVEFEGNTERGGTVERDDKGTPEDLSDDELIYTPPADFSLNETDSFTYTIADPNNQTATATVNVLAVPIFVEQNNNLNPFLGVNVGGDANPTVGDLDGDGDEDVLVGNGDGEIEYFRNDGDSFTKLKGTENPFKGVDVGWDAKPAVGDLDEDGDEDVLVINSLGKIQYFRNDGDSFTEQKGSENPFKGVFEGWGATPTIFDVDGDGFEDVLIGNDYGEIKYFRNEGDSFTEQKGSENPFKGVDMEYSAAPIDVDSDGDEDLLVGNYDENLKYFRNDSGTFTEQKGSMNPFKKMNVGYSTTPTVIDLDGDGDEDVLVGNDDGKIKYLENLTTDVNDAPIAKNDSVGILDNNPVTINVLKNDSEPEKEPISLVEFEGNTEAGGTVELDDKGTPEDLTDDELIYTPPADFLANQTDSFTYTITDKNNQTATATVNVLAVPIFVEQDNNLNPFKGVDVGYSPSPTVGDLDGDGDEDILIGNSDGEIKYFRNEGDSFTEQKGTENPFKGVFVGYNAYSVNPAIGDLDGDGNEDVLVGNDYGKIKYFRNEGDSFIEQKGSKNPFKGVDLGWIATPTIFDVDGDGFEDVLVGDSYGKIKYFRNEGDSFTEQKGSENPFKGVELKNYNGLTRLDVDSDGDEDLLVGNDEKLKYFRNDSGTFTEQKLSQNPFKRVDVGYSATPTVIDLDGDGDEDVLVGNAYGEIKYLENLTTNVNDAPIAKNDSVGILDNNPVTINVLKNDSESEKEPISLVEFEGDTERGGTVERDDKGTPEDLSDDELIYTPPADFLANQTDSFTYTITDKNNQTATATVNVLAVPIFVEQNNNLNPFFSVDVGSYANPAIADLDGDNDQDVLIGNDLESVQYFRNESGTFTEVTGSDNPFNDMVLGREPSPTIGDLDGDGDNDVLIGDELGKIKYFENKSGTFTEKTGSDNPLDGVNVGVDASPAMGDLDGDNDLDLLVGNFKGKIQYFKNEGGTFTEQIGNNNPFAKINVYSDASPTIVDFDGDGDDDVLVGNDWGELLYFQNNQGSFEQLKGDRPFAGINTGEETSPAMGDLDEDGDVDVLIGVVDGTLKYLENNPGDILTGTQNSDTFTLGNSNNSFYANKGEEDYALIQNFDSASDIIQLNGTAENYQLGVSPVGLEEGTAILLNSTELIGIVEGVSELNIKADYFSVI